MAGEIGTEQSGAVAGNGTAGHPGTYRGAVQQWTGQNNNQFQSMFGVPNGAGGKGVGGGNGAIGTTGGGSFTPTNMPTVVSQEAAAIAQANRETGRDVDPRSGGGGPLDSVGSYGIVAMGDALGLGMTQDPSGVSVRDANTFDPKTGSSDLADLSATRGGWGDGSGAVSANGFGSASDPEGFADASGGGSGGGGKG